MTALTIIQGGKGEARVDSRLIASHMGNKHHNTMGLLAKYESSFERFGKVLFKTEALAGSKTGQKERFALLNEDQAIFLLTLSRNTNRVVDLKAMVVQAFKEARQTQPAQAIEYLPGYHELHDKAHELANGSANERFVHMNLNKLVNKTVGIGSGQRTKLPPPTMSLTVVAQTLAAKAMEGAKDHHDGYARAKQALCALGQALILRSA